MEGATLWEGKAPGPDGRLAGREGLGHDEALAHVGGRGWGTGRRRT